MKNYLIIFFIILFLTLNSNAAKLDLSADINASAKSYQNLIFTNTQKNLSYFTENAEINFTVKKINLEKTDNSWMDISLGIKAVDIDKTTKTINSPQLYEGINRYPQINTAIINQAFVKIHNFLEEGLITSFGKQKYTLGQGLVLSDNETGLTGAKFEKSNFLKMDNFEFFIWRALKDEKIYNIKGINLNKNWGDGTWQLYYLTQNSNFIDSEIGWTSKEKNKKFTGIRYNLDKNQIYFDGEFAIQRGDAKNLSRDKIKYKGYAFSMKGQWTQNTPILGKTKTRISYSKSSGNSSNVSNEDKSFYPEFSLRYNGFEHSGTGALYSAGIFDTLKTSNTINGLPDGISGLNTIDIGFDFPYKKLWISLDYLIYKAAYNINDPGNTKLGTEWDIKANLPLGEKIDFNIIYANFKPQGALIPPNSKYENIKLFSVNIKARF